MAYPCRVPTHRFVLGTTDPDPTASAAAAALLFMLPLVLPELLQRLKLCLVDAFGLLINHRRNRFSSQNGTKYKQGWGSSPHGNPGPSLVGVRGLCQTGEWKGNPQGQGDHWVKEVGARTQILSLAHFTRVVQKPGKFPTKAGQFPRLHLQDSGPDPKPCTALTPEETDHREKLLGMLSGDQLWRGASRTAGCFIHQRD
ncbi:hypothetical protein UY3_03269 [Chelonia mydas]|uniref:Uncharacterized protein n=1 Tax=Chelonia mydas TaxID=8469 RepID=M7BQJ2_CHEMY|nr:hypothetical protein UY3_03269 [Chelonia mydas]